MTEFDNLRNYALEQGSNLVVFYHYIFFCKPKCCDLSLSSFFSLNKSMFYHSYIVANILMGYFCPDSLWTTPLSYYTILTTRKMPIGLIALRFTRDILQEIVKFCIATAWKCYFKTIIWSVSVWVTSWGLSLSSV